MSQILGAGFKVTNDLDSIDVHTVDLSLAVFEDGFERAAQLALVADRPVTVGS